MRLAFSVFGVENIAHAPASVWPSREPLLVYAYGDEWQWAEFELELKIFFWRANSRWRTRERYILARYRCKRACSRLEFFSALPRLV